MMIPSLGFLTSILTGLVAKLSIAQLEKHGYMPQSTYVNKALKALENDDLDEAISNYRLATAKKRNTNQTEIPYEIISQAIALRVDKLHMRIDELEGVLRPPVLSIRFWENRLPRHRSALEEQSGCEEAIAVLTNIKGQLTSRN